MGQRVFHTSWCPNAAEVVIYGYENLQVELIIPEASTGGALLKVFLEISQIQRTQKNT